MRRFTTSVAAISTILVLLLAGSAEAQWVFLARKALGRVESLTSPSTGSGQDQGGYEVATVLLEANAGKVYEAAVKLLGEKPEVKVTRKDDAARTIEFTKGDQAITMKISSLDEKLTQIMVASAASAKKPSGTSAVVEGVLRVCEKMGVQCSQTPQ